MFFNDILPNDSYSKILIIDLYFLKIVDCILHTNIF